jgi:hypothetical protein
VLARRNIINAQDHVLGLALVLIDISEVIPRALRSGRVPPYAVLKGEELCRIVLLNLSAKE